MKKITEQWLNNDPRGKLLLALVFSISTILPDSMGSLLIIFCLAILFCLIARVAPAYILKRSLLVNVFMLFVWLAVPWQLEFIDGHWSLTFNFAALWLALGITLKCNAIFLAWMGLLWRTNLNSILQALASWRIPPKLLAMFFLFCRFSQIILLEYTTLRRAMKARGFRAGFRRHTFKTYAGLITTMLLRGFERAEVVYNAMLCRGFQGRFYFSAHGLVWQRRNSLLFAVALSVIILAVLPSFYPGLFS